jgi:hypothetical protein
MDERTLLRELDRRGILLLTDPRLSSVVECVTGKPAKGSWWSHPRGKEIFAACEALRDHRDVLVSKLVLRKVTFVHRRLWPAVWSIATAREAWQMDGLPKAAATLLARIDEEGELVRGTGSTEKRAVDELEQRLLVHAREVHTERGHHERVVVSWARWARAAKFKPSRKTIARARAELEAAVPGESAAHRLWPWETPPRGRSRAQ